MNIKVTDELRNSIINFYKQSPITIKDLSKKFNLSCPIIGKILKDIPKYKKAQIFNPELKEDFFSCIDTEEKAYYLGLIIADGNVFKESNTSNRQSSISITLDSNDEYILERFKNLLYTNTTVSYDGRGCSQIAIRSDKMADDLSKYGIVPRKSFSTYLPKIDDNLMRHLFRGILDGDGCIYIHNIKSNKLSCTIGYCGSHKLMQDLSSSLKYFLPTINTIPKVYDYKNRQLSEIKINCKNDVLLLGDWIYKDATIFLTRKYDKFIKFKDSII